MPLEKSAKTNALETDTYPQKLMNQIFVPLRGAQSPNRNLIYAFACFLATITKGLHLERRLGTSIRFHPILSFLKYFLIARS